MKTLRSRLRDGLSYCGVLIIVAAVLPLLAIAVVVLRATFLAAAILGLAAAAVLFCSHGGVRAWARGFVASTPRAPHSLP